MKYLIMASCLTVLMAASCKKNKPTPITELEKLPPITQTGANTFGCLLNSEAFTPEGGGVFDNVLSVQYDPTFGLGSLRITAKQILNGNNHVMISIHGDSINTTGQYSLSFQSKYSVLYSATSNLCLFNTYDPPSPNIISGILSILKFDINSRLISGTFSFKISTDQCGTIEATDGRFDVTY